MDEHEANATDVGAVAKTLASEYLENGDFSRGDFSKKDEDAPTDLVDQRFFNPVNNQWQEAMCAKYGVELKSRLKTAPFKTLGKPITCVDSIPDGNCFYRALSVWITGEQSAHRSLREELTKFMLESPRIKDFFGNEESRQVYIAGAEVWDDGEWATEIEIISASIMLNTTIMVYCNVGQYWDWQAFHPGLYSESDSYEPCIYIVNTNHNHFDTVTDVLSKSEDRGDTLSVEEGNKKCGSDNEKVLPDTECDLQTTPDDTGIDDLNDVYYEVDSKEFDFEETQSIDSGQLYFDCNDSLIDDITKENIKKSVRSILNMITLDNISLQSDRLKALPIETFEHLDETVNLIFEKATQEPCFTPLCASLCHTMQNVQVSSSEGSRISFKKLIIGKCQRAFELIKTREKDSAKEAEEIRSCKDSKKKEELQISYEDNKIRIRRRSIGNCRLIGELFNQNIINDEIINYLLINLICIHDEEPLECLCVLLKTVGKDLEQLYNMDELFNKLRALTSNEMKSMILSRIRFMILDIIDLRNNMWTPRSNDLNSK